MIDPSVARTSFVVPALTKLGLYTIQAEKLLMGTAAVESNFRNFVQFGGGPARGMFQMEPPTFQDLTSRFLAAKSHHTLRAIIATMSTKPPPSFSELTTNHLLAAALARIKYYTIHPPIPPILEDQAQYWWTYYNGRSPHGLKPKDYLASWNKYCAALYK